MSVSEITEKIEQLVFDENKIVTYKLLSTELSVHVNKAKQLLNEYFTDHCAERKNDLNVYYAVSGFQKYNGHKIHKLTVVPKDELEKIKKDFSTLSSIHIYSIQKCSSLDECSLYSSDYLITKASDDPSEFSAIRHPNRKIRQNMVVKNAESGVDKGKNKTLESQSTRKTEPKSSVPSKKANPLFTSWQKKGDLKNEQKDKTVKEQNDLPPAPNNDKTTVGKTNNRSPQKASKVVEKDNKSNIMNLFSKQAVKSTSKLNAQNSEKSVAQNNVPSERAVKEKAGKRNDEKEKVKSTEVKTRQVEASSKNKGTVQKKRQKNQRSHDSENESDDEWQKPKKKKHKRIVSAFSDSSESESEEEEKKDRAQRSLANIESNVIEEDEEDPLPPPIHEDEEEPIPPTPPVPTSNGKRKKLKTVSKMFEDEDGFLVTKKLKEYVTDSEGSDNEAAAAAHVKAVPKAVPKPDIKQNFVNKKQASLMSFFKQK